MKPFSEWRWAYKWGKSGEFLDIEPNGTALVWKKCKNELEKK